MPNDTDSNYAVCPIERLSDIVEEMQSKSEMFLLAFTGAVNTNQEGETHDLLWREAFSIVCDCRDFSKEAQECLGELLANLECCETPNTLDFECD